MTRYFMLILTLFGSVSASWFSDTNLQANYLKALSGSIVESEYQFELLGNQDASEDIQEYVRQLKMVMNIHEKIAIKQMNENAISLFGRNNCFATHNAIFVNEEWLEELEDDHRSVVLAHELDHIRQKDALVQLSLKATSWGAFLAACYLLHTYEFFYATIPVLVAGVLMLQCAYKRYTERRSDYTAARYVGEEPTVNYLQTQIKSYEITNWFDWLLSWFQMYPSKDERIAYVKKDT